METFKCVQHDFMLCVDSCAGQCQNMIYLKIIMHPEHVADNCPSELFISKMEWSWYEETWGFCVLWNFIPFIAFNKCCFITKQLSRFICFVFDKKVFDDN